MTTIPDFEMIEHLAQVVLRIKQDKRYDALFKGHKYRCQCNICDELNIPEHQYCICDMCKLQMMDAAAELAGAIKLADQMVPGLLTRHAKLKIDLFGEGD